MSTCKTCKHWDTEGDDEHDTSLGTRICNASPMLWRVTGWDKNEPGLVVTPEYAKTTAFVQDGSDYRAWLYTKPEHGCTMHEAKP